MIDTGVISEDDRLRILKLMLHSGLTYVQAWNRLKKLAVRDGREKV